MANEVLKGLGIGAVCILACSLPVIVPMLGLGALSLGMGTGMVLSGIAIATAAAIFWRRRRLPSGSCSIDGSCGCKE